MVCGLPCPSVMFKGTQSKAVWSPEALHYQFEHITAMQFSFKTKCVGVKTCSALDVKAWAIPKSTKRGWHLVRIFHHDSWSLPLLDKTQMHNTQAAFLGRADSCSSPQTPSPEQALMPTACASQHTIKAEPSPPILSALSRALRSKTLAQSVALRSGN